jgi:tRNA threonylcarbamoyladenosine biosynthesis protein TsaB
MQRILALDTSTWWAGLAAVERDGDDAPTVVGEIGFLVRASHAARLLDGADRLLSSVGWDRRAVDGYVAVRGPGSFTGVRVGLGTIRGLALAAGRPCAGVVSLEALAHAHGLAEANRLAVLDAGRGELYGALYDACASPPSIIEPPRLGSADSFRGVDPAVVVPAPGSRRLAEVLRTPSRRVAAEPRSIAAAAGALALLHRDWTEGPSGASVAPLYLRPPDVERDAPD